MCTDQLRVASALTADPAPGLAPRSAQVSVPSRATMRPTSRLRHREHNPRYPCLAMARLLPAFGALKFTRAGVVSRVSRIYRDTRTSRLFRSPHRKSKPCPNAFPPARVGGQPPGYTAAARASAPLPTGARQ